MSDVAFEDNPRLLAYQIRQNTERLERLNEWRREVDTTRAAEKVRMDNLVGAMEDLAKSVDGIRRALVGFALTIAGSAVVFALSILVATGKV